MVTCIQNGSHPPSVSILFYTRTPRCEVPIGLRSPDALCKLIITVITSGSTASATPLLAPSIRPPADRPTHSFRPPSSPLWHDCPSCRSKVCSAPCPPLTHQSAQPLSQCSFPTLPNSSQRLYPPDAARPTTGQDRELRQGAPSSHLTQVASHVSFDDQLRVFLTPAPRRAIPALADAGYTAPGLRPISTHFEAGFATQYNETGRYGPASAGGSMYGGGRPPALAPFPIHQPQLQAPFLPPSTLSTILSDDRPSSSLPAPRPAGLSTVNKTRSGSNHDSRRSRYDDLDSQSDTSYYAPPRSTRPRSSSVSFSYSEKTGIRPKEPSHRRAGSLGHHHARAPAHRHSPTIPPTADNYSPASPSPLSLFQEAADRLEGSPRRSTGHRGLVPGSDIAPRSTTSPRLPSDSEHPPGTSPHGVDKIHRTRRKSPRGEDYPNHHRLGERREWEGQGAPGPRPPTGGGDDRERKSSRLNHDSGSELPDGPSLRTPKRQDRDKKDDGASRPHMHRHHSSGHLTLPEMDRLTLDEPQSRHTSHSVHQHHEHLLHTGTTSHIHHHQPQRGVSPPPSEFHPHTLRDPYRRRAVSMQYDFPTGGRFVGASGLSGGYQSPSVIGVGAVEMYDDGASVAGSGMTFMDGPIAGRTSQYGLPKYAHQMKPDYRR